MVENDEFKLLWDFTIQSDDDDDDDDNDGDEDDDTKGNKPAGIQDFCVLLSLSKHC